MIKLHTKYLTTLFVILLLSIISRLVSNTSYSDASNQQVKNQKFPKKVDAGVQQGSSVHVFSSITFSNKGNFICECNEKFEDEDEKSITSQKKNSHNSYDLFTLINNCYSNFLLLRNSQALHFSKHFSRIPSNKLFIIFQVFRI